MSRKCRSSPSRSRRRRTPHRRPIAQSDAVALFAARARAVRPTFVLDAATAPSVAALCRRLDGLPLAIELAAAWIKVLPLPALLARLEQRLPLLTDRGRDAPARHQTMRATIAWSYDLLPPEEQQLLRHLSVFAGGFDLEAVTAVAPDDKAPALLTGLASLVDMSLLHPVDDSAQRPRFGMLETVREFAREQLDQSGVAEEAWRRHAAYFLTLAEEAEPAILRRAMSRGWSGCRPNTITCGRRWGGCSAPERST